MKLLKFSLVAAVTLCTLSFASSCKKEKIDWETLDSSKQTEIETKEDATKFANTPVVWMGISDEYASNIASRAASIKSELAENDLIIFATVDKIKSNIELIKKAYDKGAAIIVVKPVMSEVVDLLVDNGWKHLFPSNDEAPLFYAFSKKGAFALRKPIKCTPETVETDVPGAEATITFKDEDVNGAAPSNEFDFDKPGLILKPLVKWINGVVEPRTKAYTTSDGETCSFEDVLTWQCDLFVHHVAASSDDRIKGIYQAGVVYVYKPLYVQKISEGSVYGDFYQFQAEYSSNTGDKSTGGVWYGDDYVNKHGGISVHITGAFTRNISFTTYINGDGTYPYFYCAPQPTTDNNKVNYTETESFNIGGGVTGGISSTDGTQMGKPMQTETANLSASFNWGYSQTSTVQKSVSDVSVTNRSSHDYDHHGAAAGWKFIFGNLPKPDGDKGFNWDCPESAHSWQSFPTQWVWNSQSHAEGTFDSLGDLVTVIEPVLGATHNGLCVDGQQNTWELGAQTLKTRLAVPNRISFGTAKINNDLDAKYVMHDIVIKSISDNPEVEPVTVFEDKSDYPYGSGVSFSLPVGKYDISFVMYNKETKTHEKYVLDDTDPYYSYYPYVMEKRVREDDVKLLDISVRFKKEEN